MKVTKRILFGALLISGALSANAGVIGSVPVCNYVNDPYTFCNSSYTAPVSGSTFAFEVRFAGGSFIETLLANPVEVDLFPDPDFTLRPLLSNFSLSLLDVDGNILLPALTFDSGVPGSLRFFSFASIAAGARIGGFTASMDCAAQNGNAGVCDNGMTFSSVAITVDNIRTPGGLERSLRTGSVPEPTSFALMGLGLMGFSLKRFRRG